MESLPSFELGNHETFLNREISTELNKVTFDVTKFRITFFAHSLYFYFAGPFTGIFMRAIDGGQKLADNMLLSFSSYKCKKKKDYVASFQIITDIIWLAQTAQYSILIYVYIYRYQSISELHVQGYDLIALLLALLQGCLRFSFISLKYALLTD